MPAVRITAEYVSDDLETTEKWHIVIDAAHENGTFKKQQCFGFSSKTESNVISRWPFVLRLFDKEKNKWGLDYGTDSEWEVELTNIFDRTASISSYFTVFGREGEHSYKIIEISPL